MSQTLGGLEYKTFIFAAHEHMASPTELSEGDTSITQLRETITYKTIVLQLLNVRSTLRMFDSSHTRKQTFNFAASIWRNLDSPIRH